MKFTIDQPARPDVTVTLTPYEQDMLRTILGWVDLKSCNQVAKDAKNFADDLYGYLEGQTSTLFNVHTHMVL